MNQKTTQIEGVKKGVGVHVHREDLEVLEERLGYVFNDRAVFERALTHRSFVNEAEETLEDNQRLEFLGDAVLGLVTADELFHRDLNAPEGALSNRQSQLVCEPTLATLAEYIELGTFLRLGRGETMTGGRKKSGLLADAMEALFAAIYLDAGQGMERGAGIEAARSVILRLLDSAMDDASAEEDISIQAADHKSVLQRQIQLEFQDRPVYEIVEESGPPHERVFIAEVKVGAQCLGRGEGTSKKRAEQEAAAHALESLREEGPSSSDDIFDGVR